MSVFPIFIFCFCLYVTGKELNFAVVTFNINDLRELPWQDPQILKQLLFHTHDDALILKMENPDFVVFSFQECLVPDVMGQLVSKLNFVTGTEYLLVNQEKRKSIGLETKSRVDTIVHGPLRIGLFVRKTLSDNNCVTSITSKNNNFDISMSRSKKSKGFVGFTVTIDPNCGGIRRIELIKKIIKKILLRRTKLSKSTEELKSKPPRRFSNPLTSRKTKTKKNSANPGFSILPGKSNEIYSILFIATHLPADEMKSMENKKQFAQQAKKYFSERTHWLRSGFSKISSHYKSQSFNTVILLGDLNFRINPSAAGENDAFNTYFEYTKEWVTRPLYIGDVTRVLTPSVVFQDRHGLEWDQLKLIMNAKNSLLYGSTVSGWEEGEIHFPPTFKKIFIEECGDVLLRLKAHNPLVYCSLNHPNAELQKIQQKDKIAPKSENSLRAVEKLFIDYCAYGLCYDVKKNRLPAYTDRIIFKQGAGPGLGSDDVAGVNVVSCMYFTSLSLEIAYKADDSCNFCSGGMNRLGEIKGSDHAPVSALFTTVNLDVVV